MTSELIDEICFRLAEIWCFAVCLTFCTDKAFCQHLVANFGNFFIVLSVFGVSVCIHYYTDSNVQTRGNNAYNAR